MNEYCQSNVKKRTAVTIIAVVLAVYGVLHGITVTTDLTTALKAPVSYMKQTRVSELGTSMLQGAQDILHHLAGNSTHHEEGTQSEHVISPSLHAGATTSASGPVKVVLYTYMRSGSSFTGELFSHDRDTFYWFEPVDGMYSELYGMSWGVFPLDLFYYSDGSKRTLPDFEVDFITSATQKILNCDFDQLPASVISQKFMSLRTYNGTKPFKQCMSSLVKAKNAKIKGKGKSAREEPAWRCKSYISKFCPKHFGKSANSSQASQCYHHLHDHQNKASIPPGFKLHDQCIKRVESNISMCIKTLIKSCKSQRVRSFKAIRLSMEVMENLIVQEPAVKIIHLVRDPRGIVSSRFSTGQLSVMSKHNLQKEARALCHRMLLDMEIYARLQAKYPHNIIQLKYEDIAKSPQEKASFLYKFTRGVPVPGNVLSFIHGSTNATKDNGSFGTSRANPTETANRWKTRLSGLNMRNVSIICKTVIEKLGYG